MSESDIVDSIMDLKKQFWAVIAIVVVDWSYKGYKWWSSRNSKDKIKARIKKLERKMLRLETLPNIKELMKDIDNMPDTEETEDTKATKATKATKRKYYKLKKLNN